VPKRKNQISSKLDSETQQPAGWRDQVAQPTASSTEKIGKLQRKTYLLTPALIARISELADHEKVGVNELVRYLLTYALEQVDTGKHTLPAEPVQQRTLGV
jgi:hypothetical protein